MHLEQRIADFGQVHVIRGGKTIGGANDLEYSYGARVRANEWVHYILNIPRRQDLSNSDSGFPGPTDTGTTGPALALKGKS